MNRLGRLSLGVAFVAALFISALPAAAEVICGCTDDGGKICYIVNDNQEVIGTMFMADHPEC